MAAVDSKCFCHDQEVLDIQSKDLRENSRTTSLEAVSFFPGKQTAIRGQVLGPVAAAVSYATVKDDLSARNVVVHCGGCQTGNSAIRCR